MIARGKVTVFGGTGFLGRRVVRHLLECEWSIRVASRHPERAVAFFPDVRLGIESIHAEINDGHSVAAALAAVEGVVNAVSLYVENGQHTFRSVHVAAAARVARLAREAGVEQLTLRNSRGIPAARGGRWSAVHVRVLMILDCKQSSTVT